jgi:dipeptidyl aminopeptidase/acylaminoacyl peptidase
MSRLLPVASLLVASLLVLGFLISLHAVASDDGTSTLQPWKPEDFIYAESVPEYSLSPDGGSLVWIKSMGDKEKDTRVSQLFLSRITEEREVQLIRGNDEVFLPRWSPDSSWIVFLSSKARTPAKPDTAPIQIWLINAHGGEAYPLTELPHAPGAVDWLDKETIIFSAQEDPTAYELAQKKNKDDSKVVDDSDHEAPIRLFKLSVKDGKISRLTNNKDWIQDWSVSKDGKYVVASHAKSLHYVFDQKTPPAAILHNISDGSEKRIFTEGRVRPLSYHWSPDNSGFYAIVPFSNDPKFLTASIEVVYFYDVTSGKTIQVPLDWENGLGQGLSPTRDGFVTQLAAGSHFEAARYTREKSGDSWTWKRADIEGEHAENISSLDVNADASTLVYQYSRANQMPQLYRASLDGAKLSNPVQLTRLNGSLTKSRSFTKIEIVRWTGSNNEEVEGLLFYPANYDAGKKYPLITAIHGGPMGSDKDLWGQSWAYPINLFTQRGTFVLRPNYHGSNNYGLKWAESICCGKYYDLETPDINMGVDSLIAKGLVDPEKVATMGWSNGSILSTSLITTYPARYKVASVGAGDVEWISDWGNVIFGDSFDSYYFGKSPMEDPQLYLRKSPLFKLDKVQAPVLIFHGTADTNVPAAQSWSYFRVLQYYGKVPVKFVIFPGEPHGPRKLTHQMRKVEEEMAWFDKYFFNTAAPLNEAVKAGSPLDLALKSKSVAHSGTNYGVNFAGHGKSLLIPEVVKHENLEIGRFEITRAQFAVFDSSFKFSSGTENYPANGIRFEQAQAYADWLSKLTGKFWRLPNENELTALWEKRDGENTLEFWAGYPPNPDDAARLREKMKELAGSAPLLKAVGSFAGEAGEDESPLFDLGGNVAEWAITPGGRGKRMGGSADCPASPRSDCEASSEYTGFRVVRGARPVSPTPAAKNPATTTPANQPTTAKPATTNPPTQPPAPAQPTDKPPTTPPEPVKSAISDSEF